MSGTLINPRSLIYRLERNQNNQNWSLTTGQSLSVISKPLLSEGLIIMPVYNVCIENLTVRMFFVNSSIPLYELHHL